MIRKSIIVAVALSCLAFLLFVATRNRTNTLDADLRELAGSSAIDLGFYTDGAHTQVEERLHDAYLAGQPFYLRHRRTYRNIHGPEEWEVEEGYVLTSDGRFFHLRHRDSTFLKSRARARYEWTNVEVHEHSSGSGRIGCELDDIVRLGDY